MAVLPTRFFAFAAAGMLAMSAMSVAPASAQEQDKGFFSSINPFSKPKPAAPRALPKRDLTCPRVSVQAGTAAFMVYERGKDGDPMALRYQVRFNDFARECVDLGAEVGIRVGITGRAMVGPKGTPGQKLDVPIRFVVLDDKQQVLSSTVTRLQIVIPPDQSGIAFTHVEEIGSLPMPADRMKGWDIRIGFDSKAGRGAQG